jgi:Galactose oxidase, central domain
MFANLSIFLLCAILQIAYGVQIKTLTKTLSSDTLGTSQTNEILTWYKTSDMVNVPDGRRGHSAVISGDNILIFGGCYLDQECFSDLLNYNTMYVYWLYRILERENGLPLALEDSNLQPVKDTQQP